MRKFEGRERIWLYLVRIRSVDSTVIDFFLLGCSCSPILGKVNVSE